MGELAIERAVKLEIAVSMVSEGGLERPQSTPLSTGPQWKGLGGVVIGAQPFALVLDLPPDTHIL